MKSYLKLIDEDTIKNRCDVTPVFSNFNAFNELINDLILTLPDTKIDLVAGIDALGFILGTAIAQKLKIGFLPIRKGNKLPVITDRLSFTDYSGEIKELEIRKDIIKKGIKVLIVDEWIETGAQVNAAIQLIENQGGIIRGIATINIDDNKFTKSIKNNYKVYSLLK